jgi:hypothetical protein
MEAEDGQYAGLERLAEDEGVRVSSSGKSIVIPDGFVNYFVEIDIIEDYLPVEQQSYDAIISVKDIRAYIQSWNLMNDDEGFNA